MWLLNMQTGLNFLTVRGGGAWRSQSGTACVENTNHPKAGQIREAFITLSAAPKIESIDESACFCCWCQPPIKRRGSEPPRRTGTTQKPERARTSHVTTQALIRRRPWWWRLFPRVKRGISSEALEKKLDKWRRQLTITRKYWILFYIFPAQKNILGRQTSAVVDFLFPEILSRFEIQWYL